MRLGTTFRAVASRGAPSAKASTSITDKKKASADSRCFPFACFLIFTFSNFLIFTFSNFYIYIFL